MKTETKTKVVTAEDLMEVGTLLAKQALENKVDPKLAEEYLEMAKQFQFWLVRMFS